MPETWSGNIIELKTVGWSTSFSNLSPVYRSPSGKETSMLCLDESTRAPVVFTKIPEGRRRNCPAQRFSPLRFTNTMYNKPLDFIGLKPPGTVYVHIHRDILTSVGGFHFGTMPSGSMHHQRDPCTLSALRHRCHGWVTSCTALQETGCGVGSAGRVLGLRQDGTLRQDSCVGLNINSELQCHLIMLALRSHRRRSTDATMQVDSRLQYQTAGYFTPQYTPLGQGGTTNVPTQVTLL